MSCLTSNTKPICLLFVKSTDCRILEVHKQGMFTYSEKKACYGGIKSHLREEDEEPVKSDACEPKPCEPEECEPSPMQMNGPKSFKINFVVSNYNNNSTKFNIKQNIKARIHEKKKKRRKKIMDQGADPKHQGKYLHGISDKDMIVKW